MLDFQRNIHVVLKRGNMNDRLLEEYPFRYKKRNLNVGLLLQDYCRLKMGNMNSRLLQEYPCRLENENINVGVPKEYLCHF